MLLLEERSVILIQKVFCIFPLFVGCVYLQLSFKHTPDLYREVLTCKFKFEWGWKAAMEHKNVLLFEFAN